MNLSLISGMFIVLEAVGEEVKLPKILVPTFFTYVYWWGGGVFLACFLPSFFILLGLCKDEENTNT